MIRLLLSLLLVVALGACATVEYAPYEAKNAIKEGQGGAKVVVQGVDFWADGEPPRRYKVIGVVSGQIGDGWGADDAIRSAVAAKVKEVGGQGAIALGSARDHAGYIPLGGMMVAASNRTIRYAVIQYVD